MQKQNPVIKNYIYSSEIRLINAFELKNLSSQKETKQSDKRLKSRMLP